MSCLWFVHTCVLTTPLFSHLMKYPENNSTQNEGRAPEKAERSSPQEMPGGLIRVGRHTNFTISSNTQWICDTHIAMDSTQRETCKSVEE